MDIIANYSKASNSQSRPLIARIRVSTKQQARHGHSLVAQERAAREFAARQNRSIIEVSAGAISGRSPENREEIFDLLDLAEQRKADLLVFSEDRLIRDNPELLKFAKQFLGEHGLELIELHSRESARSEATKAAMREGKRLGKHNGRPKEDRSKRDREILSLRTEGHSIREIEARTGYTKSVVGRVIQQAGVSQKGLNHR